MFQLFCVTIFASQFKYFIIGGVQITPVRVCLVALILMDLITHRGKLIVNKKNSIWLFTLLIWNIWALLSFIWAKDQTALIRTIIILLEALVLIFYAQRLIDTKERAAAAIFSLIIPCVIHNALGWLEITRKIYLFSKYTELYSEFGYPVSTFTNTNNYGMYMSLMSVILLGIVFISEKKILRFGCVALLASTITLVFRTGSRAAIIGLLFGVILLLLLLRKNLKFAIATVSVLLVAGIVLMVNPAFFRELENLYQAAFQVRLDAVSGSDYYRINMLENGMDFFDSTYGFGIAPGNVEYWMQNYGTRFTNHVNNLHNWWIEILVGSGVVVFAAVIIAWLSSYRKLILKYISGYNRNAVSVLISFGIVYAIGCIAPSTLYSAEWPWFMLGLYFFFIDNVDLLGSPEHRLSERKRINSGLTYRSGAGAMYGSKTM